MNELSNQKILFQKIIELSEANNWNDAFKEWSLSHIYLQENFCLCGHSILENCVLINNINKNTAVVGNVCVNKFLEIDSNSLFVGLKRILRSISKSVSKKLIKFCFDKDIINFWEYKFYLDIHRKRNLTDKMVYKKTMINLKIINHFKR